MVQQTAGFRLYEQRKACNDLTRRGKTLHQGIAGDHIGDQPFPQHFTEEHQGSLWLIALSTCTDQGVADGYIGHHTLSLHFVKELQG